MKIEEAARRQELVGRITKKVLESLYEYPLPVANSAIRASFMTFLRMLLDVPTEAEFNTGRMHVVNDLERIKQHFINLRYTNDEQNQEPPEPSEPTILN
jgi:hypothetical protein